MSELQDWLYSSVDCHNPQRCGHVHRPPAAVLSDLQEIPDGLAFLMSMVELATQDTSWQPFLQDAVSVMRAKRRRERMEDA